MDNYQPPFKISSEILNLVSQISELLGRISYLGDLSKMPALRRLNRLKSVQSSCAIEQNTLSLDEVTQIIDGKEIKAGSFKEQAEVINAYNAYSIISEINPYSLKDLLKVHGIMVKGLAPEAGSLRTREVGVYKGNILIHAAPKHTFVPQLINQLIEWTKTTDIHPLIKSSIFHYEFEFIHPFNDGNGRTGRYWQTLILSKWNPIFAWLPIESIIYKHQMEYYKAIEQCDHIGDCTQFIVFMLKTIKETIDNLIIDTKNIPEEIPYNVKQLLKVLQDYDEITPKELMDKLHIKSRDTLRNSYLKPAMELNLIKMVYPNTPRSKLQRYKKQ